VSQGRSEIHEEIARLHRDGAGGVVATVVSVGGSTPRSAGAKMLVYVDGRTLGSVGGGVVESQTIDRALSLLDGGGPCLLSFDLDEGTELACGGKMQIFLEPIAATPGLIVLGGGHVGLSVARVARDAGFRVTVVDDRAEMVSEERFPFADRRLAGGTALLGSDLRVDETSIVVVVTRGHRYDREWVRVLLPLKPFYLGMIGSDQKVRGTFDQLVEEGVPRESLGGIHAPIGIDIGAETPEEIAVSILAEVIAIRHGVTDTAMLKEKPEFKGRNRE